MAHGGPPLHVHHDKDEVVVVLDGRLAYRIGDLEGTADPSALLWMPPLVPHSIANAADTACRFLTIATPGECEELFRAQSEYLDSLSPGPAPDRMAMARPDGAATRRVVEPPIGRMPATAGLSGDDRGGCEDWGKIDPGRSPFWTSGWSYRCGSFTS